MSNQHRNTDDRRPEVNSNLYALILVLLIFGGGQSPDIASCVADLIPVAALAT